MIQIDIDNRSVLDALNDLLRRTGDLAPAMQDIGGVLESRVRGRFETETAPGGERWAPWAPSYDPAKGGSRPTNGNATILDLHGDMLGSLNWQADKDSVTVGFGQPYAAYHEFGTKKMKRRGLLFDDPTAGTLAQDDEDAILDIVRGYLASALD